MSLVIDIANEDCSICLEPLCKNTIVVTPCHHVFHIECYTTWITKSNKCAICRATMEKPSFVQDEEQQEQNDPYRHQRYYRMTAFLLTMVGASYVLSYLEA